MATENILPLQLKLRWNWLENCWEVFNYLYWRTPSWKWFKITDDEAKAYIDHKVPVVIEETVA